MMNKQQQLKQLSIKKKIGCELTDCGSYVTFTVSAQDLKLFEERKKTHVGRCARCHQSFKLSGNQVTTFHAVYGKATIEILHSTFDDLFDQTTND